MCGITGIIALSGKQGNLAGPLKKMTDSLRHRGPDDEGFLLFTPQGAKIYAGEDTPAADTDMIYYPHEPITNALPLPAYLAFGHRRLSIVDLSYRGHQPMCDSSARYWIVYNGEVYNHHEVKEELKSLGFCFRSTTDTEVILYAYMQWGAQCLQRFNGMFAFAIYDAHDQTVFLARDRVGIKPLYYTLQNGYFLFASEMKAILQSGLYSAEVNHEGLWHNLSFGIAPRPMTCFKNIYALEQAHWMHITLQTGDIKKLRYWQLPTGHHDFNIPERQAAEMLEAAITQSVKYRLIADVEVGTFMSGGIDSTTISAIANKLHQGIKVFTLAFDKSISEYDELEEARENARINHLNHVVKMVGAKDILDDVEHIILNQEEPYHSIHPDYVISRLVAGHRIKVILNGLGPDELLAGYRYYTRFNVWKTVRRMKLLSILLPGGVSHYLDILKELADCSRIAEYYYVLFANFLDTQKRKLFAAPDAFESKTILSRLYNPENKQFSDALQELSYFDFMHFIGNHHVSRSDLNTMHFSIEARFPYLDHHVVELAFKLPPEYKIRNGVQKYLLQQVAGKYISPRSLTMRKRGFGLPVGRWMQHELQDFCLNNLNNLKKRGIFNPTRIDAVYKKAGPTDYYRAWHLVTVEQWLQKFID